MQDRVFIDTNILIYAYSDDEKSDIANRIIFDNNFSTQVINELINVLIKKFKLEIEVVSNVLKELEDNFIIVNFSLNTQKKALNIKRQYKFQYYDSLILATALENKCKTLYTEDMQHNQKVEDLVIINPFKGNL